ncbi:ABC transporter substrate-binding protein [Actinoplanes sp. ATCC 53533]|uniref:sugar ABC transporter substrate-binding protein n=1 Tax=Actinoplanes sp. ATCC 53533 TaxID=1288362 RepID=UPI000F76CD78|nr:sugar ABC transporter substrate-binding protein [Actinoplanes sp. ATCC 53533]RSM56555.1 ABC transporter substrate-binding protein [Actinoplanes sp. ATCC 53533]
MDRRLMSLTAVAAASVLLLGACGRSDEAPARESADTISAGPATGTVTVWAQGTEGEALTGFLKDFKDQNPGVTVEVTAVPWDNAQSKYQTAIAGGTTPDIGMLGTDWMPTFANALRATPAELDTSGMFPANVASTDIGGARYGVPWYAETRVIFYRTDLMRKAGHTTFPTTWDGFKELAKAMQQKAGAKYGVGLPLGGWNSFLSSLPFAWSNGAEVMNADQTKWTLDTPETVEALRYLKSFFDEGIANKSPDNAPDAGASAFVNGSVPMMISGPWDIGQISKAGGAGFAEKFALAPMPAPPQGTSTSFAAGANLAVFKNAKNPDAAWKLIRWLADPKTQVAFFNATKDLPAQQSAWTDPVLANDPKVSVFGKQMQSVKTAPALTTWPQISAAADTQLEQIMKSGKDPAQAMKEVQSTADSLGTGPK